MIYSREQIQDFINKRCRYSSWPTTWDTTDERQATEASDWLFIIIQQLEHESKDHPLYCYIHHTFEVDGYLRCFECKHVYSTGQALLDAYNKGRREIFDDPRSNPDNKPYPGDETDPDQVPFCPECMHDF